MTVPERMTPETFYRLLCDYVEADGFTRAVDGLWSDERHEPDAPWVSLGQALEIALANDGIDTRKPPVGPSSTTRFSPPHPEESAA